jgi:hypothetical protein
MSDRSNYRERFSPLAELGPLVDRRSSTRANYLPDRQ